MVTEFATGAPGGADLGQIRWGPLAGPPSLSRHTGRITHSTSGQGTVSDVLIIGAGIVGTTPLEAMPNNCLLTPLALQG